LNVGVDAEAERATGTTLTTSQTLIVVATMSAVRAAGEPVLNRVAREISIAALYPCGAALNLTFNVDEIGGSS
jgi:hypothetical protein